MPADSLRPYFQPSEASGQQRHAPEIIDELAESQEHLTAVAERLPQLRAQIQQIPRRHMIRRRIEIRFPGIKFGHLATVCVPDR